METLHQTSRWPGLRGRTLAATLLSLLAAASLVRGQVTNIIYQDSFARAGVLNGSAPDTANANGAMWLAGPLIFTGNQTDQNGNSENAAFLSNTVPALPQPICMNAFLPLTVETGHVYTVTASVLVNTNYGLQFMWLGYSIIPSLNENYNGNCAWALIRSTNAPGTGNGNAQFFAGASTGGGTTYNWTPTSVIQPAFITYSMVLNLTNPAASTAYWYTNGVALRTNNYGAALPTANNGYRICYVGFGQNACAGYVANFSVTDVVPFPTAPTILEQPNSLTAPQGQTATFWVNAIGTPDPTYQWMTNNGSGWVNITGATNATCTTPALSSSDNNLQFEAQVSTPAGSMTSSPATLTVAAGNPTVYSVTKTANPNNIVVNFSGPVDPATSQNATNYTLNNGASVTSASAGSVPGSVVLTTSTLNPNTGYYLAVQNVQDLFGDAMTSTAVPVLPSSLVLFLRGDSGVALDGSGNVVQWLDQTTNGNNASQFFGMSPFTSGFYVPGPMARPTTGTPIGPNGLPALTFTPTSSNFLTAASTPSLSINSNMTVYVYANCQGSSGTRALICKDVGNIPASYDFEANNANLQPLFYNGSGGNGATYVGSSGPNLAAGTPHLYSATRAVIAISPTSLLTSAQSPFGVATNYNYHQTNSIPCYLDGIIDTPIGSALLGAGNSNTWISAPGFADGGQPVYIGWRGDHYTGDIMNGQLGEILLFNTALSGSDRTNVDDYLGQKYYPFSIVTPLPPTTTTSNGFAVTLTFVANQGSAHFAYQWQESGTNIPGATGSSYTTGILAPSDNGDTFAAIVSLPSGVTETNTTTLQVLDEPPYVTSAGIPIWNTSQVVVLFDEAAVDPVTATAATNYSLNNGASVLSAAIGDASNKVVLTTSPLTWSGIPGFYTLTVSNVNDVYGNTIVPASPAVGLYPPATALWVSANTGVTTNGSGGVNLWNDMSGNTNNLLELSANFDPLLAVNNAGRPVVRFVGTNTANQSFLYAPNAPSLAISGDLSIFAVVNFATLVGGTNGHILGKTGPTTTTPTQGNQPGSYDYYTGTGGAALFRGNGTNGAAQVTSSTAPSVGLAHLVDVMQQGTAVTHRLDGRTNGTGILSTLMFDAGQPLLVGARSDFAQRLTGDLSAIVLIGSALSSNDVASLESYLAAQNNVPIGTNAYPAITQQPVASTNVYESLTLTVAAAASGNPLVLQWYDTNGVAIAGQTNATLVITNIQTSDTYYLLATNAFASTTSSNTVVIVIPVSITPVPIVYSVSGTNLLMNWPSNHIGWQLQVQSNNPAGLTTNWVNVAGSIGTNQVVIPINPGNRSTFYRLMFP